MTDNQFGSKKKINRQHQRNDKNRPKGHKGNERTPERYVNSEGAPIE